MAFAMHMNLYHRSDDKRNVDAEVLSRKVIGHFSVNSKEVYCADARQLKYLYHKVYDAELSVHFNLDHMSDSTIKKKDSYKTWDKLNNVLIWVSLNSAMFFNMNEIVFVTFRGNITKIMCSPYEINEDWTICAKFSNGVIYLNSFETKNDILRKQSASSYQKTSERWGFKFEQYMLTDDPKQEPNINLILNENEEFCCVIDRKLSNHRLIIGAEMDGICSDDILCSQDVNDSLSKAEFVELKTSRTLEHAGHLKTLKSRKMLKWWCQCYLAGVETIICGFRDNNGYVTKLKRYEVKELPDLANGYWNKNICINFCIRFFDFVKRVVLENPSKMKNDVWKFDFIPKLTINASKVEDESSIYKSGFKGGLVNHVKTCV